MTGEPPRLAASLDQVSPHVLAAAVVHAAHQRGLRRLLYGLHAVLRLHLAQEDESYLSLADDSDAPQAEKDQAPGQIAG